MEYLNVLMGEVKVSSNAIGTCGIATCIGVLLVDENNKKALVGHFNSNYNGGSVDEDIDRIYNLINQTLTLNNMINELSYLIIPGIYDNPRISEVSIGLENKLSKHNKIDIKKSDIKLHDETKSLEFVFDPVSLSFVTNNYFPNDEDYEYDIVSCGLQDKTNNSYI